MKYERQQGLGYLFLDLPTKINSKGRLVLFLQMPLYFICEEWFKVPNLKSNSLLFKLNHWNHILNMLDENGEIIYAILVYLNDLFSVFSEVLLDVK